jgi:hypothetical protein
MLARLLFDESLAELADELLLLEDEDVSAADAEAPSRNARIARVDDAELLLSLPANRQNPRRHHLEDITFKTKSTSDSYAGILTPQAFDCVLIGAEKLGRVSVAKDSADAAVILQVGQYRALR